jgi:hypothetical protein
MLTVTKVLAILAIVLHNIDARALHESLSPLLVERTKYLVERDSC